MTLNALRAASATSPAAFLAARTGGASLRAFLSAMRASSCAFRTPLWRRRMRTRSLGCAPLRSHFTARSTSMLTVAGLFMGL